MQTTTLRTAQRTFSLKEWQNVKRNKLSQWLNSESEMFSAICGERFTHKEILLAHLFIVALVVFCGVAEWLEGGVL